MMKRKVRVIIRHLAFHAVLIEMATGHETPYDEIVPALIVSVSVPSAISRLPTRERRLKIERKRTGGSKARKSISASSPARAGSNCISDRRRVSPACMFSIRALTARPLTNRIAARVTNLAPRASLSAPRRHDPPGPLNPAVGHSSPNPTTVNKIQAKAQSRSGQISAHFSSSAPSPSPSHTQSTNTLDVMANATLPTRGGYDPKAPEKFTTRKIGAPHTLEHRIYVEKDGVPLSPFHDIPLYANEQQTVLNMVVEIPRWTNAKQEVRCCQSNASPQCRCTRLST